MYTMTDLYEWIGPLSTQRHQKEIRAKNKITRKLHLIASLDKLFQSLSSQKTSSAVMDNLPHISVCGYITLYVFKKKQKKQPSATESDSAKLHTWQYLAMNTKN